MSEEEIKELFAKYNVKYLKDKNGQSECYSCKQKLKYSLTWTSFLYEYEEHYYCYECLINILLQQENKELKEKIEHIKRNIEIKNAYCQLIADLGFDYDGLNQVSSLKGLIDELVKYALASRDNDDGMFVYEDGFNRKYNILNEELGDK